MEKESRLGLIGIVIDDVSKAEEVNELLHQYNDLIVARMGIPYRERNVCVITLVVDGPNDRMNALSGALGRIAGVNAKLMVQKAGSNA